MPFSQPTMIFVGVTTGSSSIMRIFPEWMRILGIDAQIAGVDAPLHAPPDIYRRIVADIAADPMIRGALVTAHKIDLLQACRDQFDALDELALLSDEISCISKRDGRLLGHAKDPISSGLAWDAFVPAGHFARTGGHVFCLGGGGAATAISLFAARTTDRPRHFTIVDQSLDRLAALRELHKRLNSDIAFEYQLSDRASANDRAIGRLPPGSLVINATGMGKDVPGSPVTDAVLFPENGLVWELNYRGALDFLRQVRAQQTARSLIIEDGWTYFLHGWTQVIAEVFDFTLTPAHFADLAAAAASFRA
jgi:shikimate 5-dehydrogenase